MWTRVELLRLGCVFLLAAACSWAGIVLSHLSEGVPTVWLSNGVIFGFLISQPPDRWLAYFAAGFAADTLADVVHGDPWSLALGVSLANLVEVAASSLLLSWLFEMPLDLSKRRPLAGFLSVAVLAATAVASVLGASWTKLFWAGASWTALFRSWWLGDLLGMAALAPPIILLQRKEARALFAVERLPRTLVILSIPLFTAMAVFLHRLDTLVIFLMPAFLLVAFLLGFSGMVIAVVTVMLLSMTFVSLGHGPWTLITGENGVACRVVTAQICAAVSLFTLLPVAVALEDRERLRCSLAASEARYRQLALQDELTGLSNRRAFNEEMSRAWEHAQRTGAWLGLLLLDADHFKQYNDVFGHLQGDECLRALAGLLRRVSSGAEVLAARYGGEEFALLLPGACPKTTCAVAEELCRIVVSEKLPHPTGPGGVQTISVGGAAVVPAAGQMSATLVRLADEALYQAKLSGRNRVAMR